MIWRPECSLRGGEERYYWESRDCSVAQAEFELPGAGSGCVSWTTPLRSTVGDLWGGTWELWMGRDGKVGRMGGAIAGKLEVRC